MDIIQIMRQNALVYIQQDQLIEELKKITNKDLNFLTQYVKTKLEEGELYQSNGKIGISADRGLYKAKLILNKKGYGFAKVDNMPDFFIPAFAINGAFDGDDVLVEITSMKTADDIEGNIVAIIKRNTSHIVGTYVIGKSKNIVFPDDVRLPQIRIFHGNGANAKNNDKVYVEIDKDTVGDKIMTGKIVEVLGKANTPQAEQLSIIRSFNLSEKFDPQTLNEARNIKTKITKKEIKSRQDYRSLLTITIDGEDARDFDDALSINILDDGGYKVYVHIADVTHYVLENSHLDKEALIRGTSVYFPNMVIPMLPNELSNGICSLNEGEDRLVLTVEITLDKNCNVVDYSINEGVICSNHRMTYTEVQNLLNQDKLLMEKYADVYPDILAYQQINNKLKINREKRGEIRFNLPEPLILENARGEIVSIENRIQDEAHEIIESLMVLANECVAKKFNELKIPFVYRVHEKPDEAKIIHLSQILKNMGVANNLEKDGDRPASYQKIVNKITGLPQEKTLTKLMLRSMSKAKYCPVCMGHFGLASQYYCHFTSPIRRYPDLQIHRIIKSFLSGVPRSDLEYKFAGIVGRVSDQSSEMERKADEVERQVDDYKKAVYMSKFLGEQFTGTISGVQEFGIFVELENGIEGMIKTDNLPMDEYVYDEMKLTLHGKSHHYTIGDSVKVIVASTNPQLRQINFELAGINEVTLKKYVNSSKKSNKTKAKKSLEKTRNKSTKRKRRK